MERKWWKEAVVYQIYPRSFYDANGDGIGDIQGVIARLDYLTLLGIDVIWLCPIYKSPNDDNGYDISDYRQIMEEFGGMVEFEELLAQAHRHGIKIIMDLVVNHTSDEHAWFIESRSSIDNAKRDYYIWRKARNGREPNNWGSFFTPSAWEYDQKTEEYYLHLFSTKQPDLNWTNSEVRDEIFSMMRWWLDKGIDGFRMDVINMLIKANGLPDAAGAGERYQFDIDLYTNQPGIHELLQEMNQRVLRDYDIMTVGETPNVTPEEAALYVGEEREELNMVFQFELMGIDSGPHGKWDLKTWRLADFKEIVAKWQLGLQDKGWNSLFLNNHDQPRMVSRFGDDCYFRVESAKMLATLIHTLQGTPYVYQGEEIGMTNVAFEDINDYRDLETLNMYREKVLEGSCAPEEIMKSIYAKGRDNARTPMQWDQSPNAGFTTGQPWIKINPNYPEINVQKAMTAPDSIFYYYQKLIKLRKENPVMVYGVYTPLAEDHPDIFAYLRTLENDNWLVLLNFTNRHTVFILPERLRNFDQELIIANYEASPKGAGNTMELKAYEARVYRLLTAD